MYFIPKVPAKSKRNELVYELHKQGKKLIEIAYEPEVIKLTGGVLTRQRIHAIIKMKKKGEQKTA